MIANERVDDEVDEAGAQEDLVDALADGSHGDKV